MNGNHVAGTPASGVLRILHTIKGKGASFLDNRLLWDYRTPLTRERSTEQ